jgi:hypothetical protein
MLRAGIVCKLRHAKNRSKKSFDQGNSQAWVDKVSKIISIPLPIFMNVTSFTDKL